MHIRRCFTSGVIVNDELYAIAGFDGARRLTSMEKYSPLLNQWTLMKSLHTPRSDAACVVHNGRIYVLGGYSGESLFTCEMYDPGTDTWHYIMQMHSKRSGACAVSLPEQNKIIILGGYNGLARIKSTEIFDPIENVWQIGPPMFNERSNFATVIIGKELYVIGGYTGQKTIEEVEKFDLLENKWTKANTINFPRSAMKAVLLGKNLFCSFVFFNFDRSIIN